MKSLRDCVYHDLLIPIGSEKYDIERFFSLVEKNMSSFFCLFFEISPLNEMQI